jgi:hypothetical protein
MDKAVKPAVNTKILEQRVELIIPLSTYLKCAGNYLTSGKLGRRKELQAFKEEYGFNFKDVENKVVKGDYILK